MPPRVVPISSAARRHYGWGTKVFVALAYMVLVGAGITLRDPSPSSGLPSLLNWMFMLMMIYWFFIHQQVHKTTYFRQNRWLLIVIAVCIVILNPMVALLFAGLGGLYWLLIVRPGTSTGYFYKYHLLTMQALGVVTLLVGCMAMAVIQLLMAIFQMIQVTEILTALASLMLILKWVEMAVLILSGLALALSALLDKTPRIPPITDWIRYWA